MMNRLARILVGMAALVLAALSNAAVAATECNTGPPGNPPLSGTIADGVIVNAGDFCILVGANVSNGVRVNQGGILILCGSTINGGASADGAAELIFGAEELPFCTGNIINGGIRISNTGAGALPPAPSIAIENSVINGSVHLTGNQGPIAVASDMIAGGLFCSHNAFDLNAELDTGQTLPVVTGALRCKFLGDE